MTTSRSVRRPWYPPTLRDVASASGASLASVSRALSADSSARRPHATADIVATAHRLGYVAGNESTSRLVVFTSDIGRTGYWETLSGICDAARATDTEVAMFVVPGSPATRRNTLNSALRSRIDGAVLLEFDSPSVEILEHLPEDLPVAIAGGYPAEGSLLPRAWIDDYQGAVSAAEHLVELGHERIGFVGLPEAGHPDPRVRGWRQVLHDHALPVIPQLGTGWSAETGRRAAAGALQAGLTAVLCGNDDLAFGVIAALSDSGKRVPDDVSVIGMDDHPLAAASTPPLTTVRLDFFQVGMAAAELALGHAGLGMSIMVQPRLIIRESVRRLGSGHAGPDLPRPLGGRRRSHRRHGGPASPGAP